MIKALLSLSSGNTFWDSNKLTVLSFDSLVFSNGKIVVHNVGGYERICFTVKYSRMFAEFVFKSENSH
jgi:hypothetical protein